VDPNNGRYLMVGSDCVYEGSLSSLVGKTCTITRFARGGDRHMVIAFFDHDRRERVVDIRRLTPKKEYTMSKLANFKTLVQTAVANLLKPLDADSAKEQAVRRLGVAAEIVRLGEADKKKAKDALKKLGIITGAEQTGVVFDSPRYVVTATTKAASTRVDESLIDGALRAEGISGMAILRIRKAIMVQTKAPVSFAVETK